ncbi:MAG TPA: helicase C-terminal domain-containing protein, partial [Spirochaetia bacterium]|nr:helicase C-terminal domain-containing protein [Spirochaetia bacterium]
LIDDVRNRMQNLDQRVLEFIGESFTYRLVGRAGEDVRRGILAPLGEFQAAVLRLVERLTEILESFDIDQSENVDVFEARILVNRLAQAASICESFTRYDEDTENIFWIARTSSGKEEFFVEFSITPLSVAGIMEEAVFTPLKTVVCTSATLSVRNSFSYWMKPLGLSEQNERVRTSVFPSPFPYDTHVLLAVPTDAPMPDNPAYVDYVKQTVGDILEISEGKGLVLFTAYSMLREVYEAVRPRMLQQGITTLKQGDEDRSKLLSVFKTDTASILFATDSFWEGVDTPGEALEVVIICRLPFRVPTDPVAKARMDAIEKGGGNSFMEMSLPEAVLKLKQGFGRLMRRSSDRGVVVILDPRILKKSYGSLFLDTLPQTLRSMKETHGILNDIERFF